MGLLLEIWKHRGQIAEGIKNSIFKKEHVEEIAEKRMGICKGCPQIDEEGDSCYVTGTEPCCRLCGCSLGIKIRAMSAECDDNQWGPIMTEEEEDNLNEQLHSE